MKTAIQRWGWPILKALLALAILAAIGHKFYDDLRRPELQDMELRPGWLVLSGGIYLLALLPSAWYWYHLMHLFGDRPRPLATLRAYFVGQLGKYVPGKAVAVILRGTLVRAADVRLGVAIIATFYEVLTTMAAGGMLAAVIFALDPPEDIPGLHWHPALTSLLLLSLCGVPLLPGVFNFVVGRTSRRFDKFEALRVPPLQLRTLTVGLITVMVGWFLLGLSVWAMLQAVTPTPWTFVVWMRCTGSIGFAYVAGFLVVFLPAGVGAREYLLLHLLAFAGGEPIVAVAVLLLRVVWTAYEVIIAGLLLAVKVRS